MSWQKVAELEELEVGRPQLAELAEPVCVVRVDADVVYAVHNVCSHQFYELHEGYVDDSEIECALHGSNFDLATGAPDSLPAVRPIPTYAVKVSGGAVYVDVEQQTNDAPVPQH
ncbi:MAG TPA: non-heme iron oxygenase ferredoxin subunit [Euzebyales bacterium]|nr:non-heme iron oxygenase ferredoxin subunit [Euzebyales bacterium]